MGRGARANPFAKFRPPNGAAVQTGLYDRYGRALGDGDAIVITGDKADIVWRVAKIAPELHPQAPVGSLKLHLVATLTTGAQGGGRFNDVIKVHDASELPAIPGAELLDADPHADAPAGAGPRPVDPPVDDDEPRGSER